MFQKILALSCFLFFWSSISFAINNENQDFKKSEEIGQGAFDFLKNAIQSERIKEFGDKAKDGVSGIYHGAKESLTPAASLCSRMSKNDNIIQSNEWWMTLGYTIQKASEKGDSYVLNELPKLNYILKKFEPKVGEDAKVFSKSELSEIGERWTNFWNKKGTLGSKFNLGTYRCIEDNLTSKEDKFVISVNAAIDIAKHLGDNNAQKKFTNMVNNFTK